MKLDPAQRHATMTLCRIRNSSRLQVLGMSQGKRLGCLLRGVVPHMVNRSLSVYSGYASGRFAIAFLGDGLPAVRNSVHRTMHWLHCTNHSRIRDLRPSAHV